MADFGQSREAQKRRLRENIINAEEERGKGEDNRLSPLVLAVIIFVLAASAAAFAAFRMFYVRRSYAVRWSRETAGVSVSETFKGYEAFAGGMIRYTKDGAEYIDANGDIVWERSFQLSSPVIAVSGSYAAIADQGGTKLYIFSRKAVTGTTETILPISVVRPSDNGIIYAVLNDSDAEYITAFREDGSPIDLSVKSIITGDGYPFDMDTSADGTQLITSYVSINNDRFENNVVFRNFGSVGQNENARRVVGGFSNEFKGHLAARVRFSGNEFSQALYDGGIVFFSTKVLNSPEIINHEVFEQRAEKVAFSGEYTAVLTEPRTGDMSGRLLIYDLKGNKKADIDVGMESSGICMTGSCTVLYNSGEIEVYRPDGRLSAKLSFDEGPIGAVTGTGRNNELTVVSSGTCYRIRY